MKQTTRITIEHIVVASDRSYEQVIEALEAQRFIARFDHNHYSLTKSDENRLKKLTYRCKMHIDATDE